jgi:hypothetical protein
MAAPHQGGTRPSTPCRRRPPGHVPLRSLYAYRHTSLYACRHTSLYAYRHTSLYAYRHTSLYAYRNTSLYASHTPLNAP